MKRFKSISVEENTFDAINRLSETLMPRIKLSKAQVVENLQKAPCSPGIVSPAGYKGLLEIQRVI